MRLSGRGAIVTGASQGIGLAIAKRLASEGAAVVIADVDEGRGARAVEQLRESATVAFLHLDVSDEAAVATMMDDAQELIGVDVDVIVCNAGRQTFAAAEDLSKREWDQVMAVNAWGAFLTMRAAGSHLRRTGRGGSVITIASRTGRVGAPTSPHYAASKAAALNLVKSFAVDYAPGIRFNSVAPGMIETELWERADEFSAQQLGVERGAPRAARIGQIPLGRSGTPDEVAAAVMFLASDDSSYLTGECIHVSGGDYLL